MISLSLLSAELQLHLGRRVFKAAPAYVVRHVVNVAPAEVFSRIARDNEDFYILESSFFLRPSFLLARSQLGCQPSSILDLVAPSPHQLLEMLGLESIQSLIRKRKLQWVAHCARRGEEDLSWKRIVREVEDGKSKWGTRLKEDWKELGVNTVRGWCNKVKDRGWLASKLGTSKKKGRAK